MPTGSTLGGWHGDWGHWNMGMAHDVLQVWDWERYDPEVPVGFDALHFAAQSVRPGEREAPRQQATFLGSVPDLLAELGVRPAQQDLTLRLYLIEIAVRYVDALTHGATPALQRRTTWVLSLLEQLLRTPPDRPVGRTTMTVRAAVPHPVKTLGRAVSVRVGSATAGQRQLPSFILVGAQRAGTTSLFRALMAHPLIYCANYHKGVNYFDVNYDRDLSWYRGHFPTAAALRARSRGTTGDPITFEASGYYMFHPRAAERMAHHLPDVKVLAMLRDPVERAFSAHKHELARGYETEPFDTALELEDTRLEGEVERMLADPGYHSFSHRHHAYLRRGQYAEQLMRLRGHFPAERIHVIESESFFEQPEVTFSRVLDFLELPQVMPERFDRWNGRPSAPMPESTRTRLREHFSSHDQALAGLLGRDPAWVS